MKANLKKLPKLFLSAFLISAVTFGGGYVIVTFFDINMLMNISG